MKLHRMQSLIAKLCSLCLVAGCFYWDGVSIFLFGEQKYPELSDYE